MNSHQILDACRNIHRDMDDFIAVYGFSFMSDAHTQWNATFEEDARKYLPAALNFIQTNHQLRFDVSISNELQELETLKDALVSLQFEYEYHASYHTREEMNWLKMILDQASNFLKPDSFTLFDWFISLTLLTSMAMRIRLPWSVPWS